MAPIARILVLLAAFTLMPGIATAQTNKAELVKAVLVPETLSAKSGTILWVDLHFDIKPGWHTYWRNPGDSGLATRIDWKPPAGFKPGESLWPKPQHFVLSTIGNYGYAGQADLLIPISVPADAGAQATLAAHASWLVCAEICVPGEKDFTLTLPVSAAAPTVDPASQPLFAAARASLPQPARFEVTFHEAKDKYVLHIPAASLSGIAGATAAFFPFDGDLIDQAAAEPFSATADGADITLIKVAKAHAPATLDGVMVVSAPGANTASRQYTVSANPGMAAATGNEPAAGRIEGWQALLLAFLGGIVLNAMPCVFPVLSLKVLALAKSAHGETAQRVKEAFAYTAGVLISFGLLGAALLAFRYAGHAVGWGFQLQSPLFVAVLAYLLFAMGLGLSGVMEIGGSLAGIGSRFMTQSGMAGSFLTGILATLVATPCTGPFMGAALGTALVAPTGVAMGIFLALGAGLAFPYLLVAMLPGLRRLLPKPGAWMVIFRQFLAFPLYGTAAWLLWVLVQQVGPAGSLAAFIGFVIVGFAAWAYGRTRFSEPLGRGIGAAIAGLCVVATLLLAVSLTQSPVGARQASARSSGGGLAYETFSPRRLAALRAEGMPVFVNLTAAWCITCQVNERLTLDRPAIRDMFLKEHVVALKGDWTNQNPEITAFLQKFGRSGVPLYLIYQGHGEPQILPQILTEEALLSPLRKS